MTTAIPRHRMVQWTSLLSSVKATDWHVSQSNVVGIVYG